MSHVFAARSSLPGKEDFILTSDTSSAPMEGARCRLLYVVGQLALGGLERQLYYLLATLERSRYRPALVAWNVNPAEKYYRDIAALKIPIYGLPSPASPIVKLRAFRRLVRALSPEVIHSYGFHTNFAAHYAASGTRAVAIGSLRGDFSTEKKSGGTIRGALNARWPYIHIANSLLCAEAVRDYRGLFAPRKIIVVRNGLDLNHFNSMGQTREAGDYVAAVGSLLPVKRWDRLVEVAEILQTRMNVAVSIRIAGEGPLRSELEKQAKNLGVSNEIKFDGVVQDIPTFLSRAKFLVHTSESEGCPNVIMEAMAAGIPVVAMAAGDIPYLVEEGKTGFVVRPGDNHGLASRIATLLNDQNLCRQMGERARKRAEQEFELHSLVTRTVNAYKAAGWREE